MFPALLTALLFAFSITFAGRSTQLIGGIKANYYRLLIGFGCLAVFAHSWGRGWAGAGFLLFFLSGAIGIGIGDSLTFQGLRKIGPRLAVLLVQCMCAPFAAIIERVWLGTQLTLGQIAGGGLILVGTALSLLPGLKVAPAGQIASSTSSEENEINPMPEGDDDKREMAGNRVALAAAAASTVSTAASTVAAGAVQESGRAGYAVGVAFAVGGALAQAIGAVVTRKANEVNEGFLLDGMTAAYQRMCGALLMVTAIFFATRWLSGSRQKQQVQRDPAALKKALPWVVGNAVAGLVFGIACFQWALRDTPAAVVLSCLALTPLLVIPMTWFLNKDRPSLLSLLGGVVAVAGVIILRRG